jgi:Ca-activated chloride channel family protein
VTAVQANSPVPVAVQIQVTWQGPDYEADYITIARSADDPGTYLEYMYTHQGNPAMLQAPSEPGTYEVRYILATDTKILAKAPIVVEAASECPSSTISGVVGFGSHLAKSRQPGRLRYHCSAAGWRWIL